MAAFVETRCLTWPPNERQAFTCWLAYRLVPSTKMGLAALLQRPSTSVWADLLSVDQYRKRNKRFRQRTDRLLDRALALNIGGNQ